MKSEMVSEKGWDDLRRSIQLKAFLTEGPYKLSSGRTSDFFFYMKPVLNDGRDLHRIARIMLHRLPPETTLVGGLSLGSVPISSTMIALNEDYHIVPHSLNGFWVRMEAKDHGLEGPAGQLEGLVTSKDKAVVVDDVTTTGSSVLRAVEAVRDRSARVLKVITLVDRSEGAQQSIESKGIEFEAVLRLEDFETDISSD
ncbi:MAG: orotate phosphoribosyltransferase [Thermoplasmata archaeon]